VVARVVGVAEEDERLVEGVVEGGLDLGPVHAARGLTVRS
jgi:hypothetical protein